MNRQTLIAEIKRKRSFLCVGLDTDIDRIPKKFLKYDNPVLEFNKVIIDLTSKYCVAYKPNTAFYEKYGSRGWKTLEDTFAYMPDNILKIADAKRGDIGNTSAQYARAFFDTLHADAVTVAPYMGSDSVNPFLEWKDKWVILLAVTSNSGSSDFQMQPLGQGMPLYQKVVQTAIQWGDPGQMMLVVGATAGDHIRKVRDLAPEHFFLVPGVGAQGGDLKEVARNAMTKNCGLLVNLSRSVIYADNSANFEEAVVSACEAVQLEMEQLLKEHHVL